MPHGYPDFGIYAPKTTTYALPDMGELAARTGSIVTYDRRGDVFHLEDFESSLVKWATTTTGAGASSARDTAVANNGDASFKLVNGTGSAGMALMSRLFYKPPSGRIGLELAFQLDANMDVRFRVRLNIRDGENLSLFHIEYVHSTTTWRYANSSGVITDLVVQEVEAGTFRFQKMKMVVDTDTDEYVRLLVNEQEHSMAGIAAEVRTDTDPVRLFLGVDTLDTSPGSNRDTNIDDLILTQNEP